MKNLISWVALVGAVIALILSIGNAVGGNPTAKLSGVTNYDALTLGTGPLVITTSNTATSTLSVGCVQTTATSTASPVKLTFTTLGATSTFPGTVYWAYGTCP